MMQKLTNTAKIGFNRGFSLIEVIVAVGILAGSALAVIAFLGATGHATSETLDRAVAARLADNIRAELDLTSVDTLFNQALPGTPIKLYATADGERVRLEGPAADALESNDPPGIADRNRYFLIEIRRMENSLDISSAPYSMSESAMLPLSVQVVWPFQLPLGPPSANPNSDPFKPVERQNQSVYIFNVAILRKQ